MVLKWASIIEKDVNELLLLILELDKQLFDVRLLALSGLEIISDVVAGLSFA